MPPPHDGNEYLPFSDLMRLEKINEVTFRSIALPFSPGGRRNNRFNPGRAYGGHVYAQAAWAACQTVEEGLLLYNVVGSYLLPGNATAPFVYKVHKIRSGRFATRIVNVTQTESNDICFTAMVSFKIEETGIVELQETIDLWEEYKACLGGKAPKDFLETPSIDLPWYRKQREETGWNDDFPGLDSKTVDMEEHNAHRHPLDRRSLIFYRALGSMPPVPNLHLCAHLYASDRNSLFIVANHMDLGDKFTQMSSLVHTTVFHSPTKALMFGPSNRVSSPMDDCRAEGKWFAHESWTTRSVNGRALFHARLWAADGMQVGTVMQDGMIRYTKKKDASEEEHAMVEDVKGRWRPRQKL